MPRFKLIDVLYASFCTFLLTAAVFTSIGKEATLDDREQTKSRVDISIVVGVKVPQGRNALMSDPRDGEVVEGRMIYYKGHGWNFYKNIKEVVE